MSTETAREFLAEQKRLADAATEGPWIADPPNQWGDDDDTPQSTVRQFDSGSITWDDHGGEVFKPEDAEFIAASRTAVPRLVAAIEAVYAEHEKVERALCGAMAEVPHRHGDERSPYPIRPVVCTEPQGHEGPHRDAVCCWNFQEFTEHAAYKSAEWADRSTCRSCSTRWPCPTVRAVEAALGGDDE